MTVELKYDDLGVAHEGKSRGLWEPQALAVNRKALVRICSSIQSRLSCDLIKL